MRPDGFLRFVSRAASLTRAAHFLELLCLAGPLGSFTDLSILKSPFRLLWLLPYFVGEG